MNLTLDNLLERFELLSGREKIILICTTLVVIWSIWDSFIYQSLSKKQQALQSDIAIAKTKLTAQQLAAEQLEKLAAGNPNKKARENLAQLQRSITELQHKLSTENKKFAPPGQMAAALRDMLSHNRQLRLIKLESQPTVSFSQVSEQPSRMYRHGLVLTLQGSYFDTLKYLQSLEELPWRINWDMINYQVVDYPDAETNIHVYTLSFEEEWLAI